MSIKMKQAAKKSTSAKKSAPPPAPKPRTEKTPAKPLRKSAK